MEFTPLCLRKEERANLGRGSGSGARVAVRSEIPNYEKEDDGS
jgi:hypothetical protein